MGKKYLHIGFSWGANANPAAVKSLIENYANAEDWFYYGGNCWIVYTQYSQTQWSEYLRANIAQTDSLVICEIANLSSSDGQLPVALWEWFNRPRF
jgi:hypothetical protein